MRNAQVIDIGDALSSPGGNIKTAGITFGADAQACENLLMGVAFDYVNSDVEFDINGKATIQGGKGSVFATWFDGNYHLNSAVGGGVNAYDTKRSGLADTNGVYIAKSSTMGYEIDGMLGGGYDATMGRLTLSPGASLYYSALSIDGFTESGSLAPLTIESINASSLQSRLGASLC